MQTSTSHHGEATQSLTSNQRSPDRKVGPVKVDVDLVLVPVTVTDQSDRMVVGLQKGSFNILDQNHPELIRHFSSEDAPISLGIVFDMSDSMWGKIERSREAVIQFLRTSNPEDEFFLVGFSTRPERLVDFTSSVDEIQDAFSKVKPDGTTALFDAIYLSMDQMKKARNKRKALLIVSDGGDNHSRYTLKEIWSVVSEADVQIYALGIFDEAPRTKAERVGPDVLHAITEITGGRTFPIYTLKKIGSAVSELSLELRNQYLIAYRPTSLAHDGKWRKITVRVTPPATFRRLRVYARAGYYAPAE
jgi:Ca-activated chloride channel family protein